MEASVYSRIAILGKKANLEGENLYLGIIYHRSQHFRGKTEKILDGKFYSLTALKLVLLMGGFIGS